MRRVGNEAGSSDTRLTVCGTLTDKRADHSAVMRMLNKPTHKPEVFRRIFIMKKQIFCLWCGLIIALSGCSQTSGNTLSELSELQEIDMVHSDESQMNQTKNIIDQLDTLQEYENVIAMDLESLSETDELVKPMIANCIELDTSNYTWISDAQELLKGFFKNKYNRDISEKISLLNYYQFDPEENDWISGFYNSNDNSIYLNKNDIKAAEEQSAKDRMIHICVHELLHAMIGLHEKQEKSGAVSSGFYEGLVESLTREIMEEHGINYDDFSVYNDQLLYYAKKIWKVDPTIIEILVFDHNWDVAARIDENLGNGVGILFLKSAFLLENEETADCIIKNLEIITDAYRQAKPKLSNRCVFMR